jgi:hypothetical protein
VMSNCSATISQDQDPNGTSQWWTQTSQTTKNTLNVVSLVDTFCLWGVIHVHQMLKWKQDIAFKNWLNFYCVQSFLVQIIRKYSKYDLRGKWLEIFGFRWKLNGLFFECTFM